MIYGTAWKEEDTARLVKLALDAGFRAIDTANQRKHYHEAGVGEAIKGTERSTLWLQTKFTYLRGQDHRLPYEKSAPLAKQVQQSCDSSLQHLGSDYIDSYVLHGPALREGLVDDDWETWGAMEALVRAGKVKQLGISNVSFKQLQALVAKANVKPACVQNRCYAQQGWDKDVREFCVQRGIVYQGFSLLTANPQVVQGARVRALSRTHKKTPEQVVFRLAKQLGMLPLTGTTSPQHMKEDLAVDDFTLSAEDVRALS